MNAIDYLKDAQLVADFQNFFGIEFEEDNQEKTSSNEQATKQQLSEEKATNGRISNNNESPDKVRQRHKDDIHINNLVNNKSRNGLVSKKAEEVDLIKSNTKAKKQSYVVKNLGFYYIFCFGASLGYEIFYALFFPFFLHNVDSFVGRRLIVIWSVVMYIGQALKDIIRWNRPKSPPVVVLEPEYSMEYGMPSTHAMVGFALPFSIFIFTQSRYVYPLWFGFTLASIWCLLVCGSRLYLGMHTVLDILAGLTLSATILFVCVPVIDLVDEFHYKSPIAPLISFVIVSLMSIYYPKSDRWSPARGDTCVMVGFGYGTLVGTWINYQLGIMTDPSISDLPFHIHWPTRWAVLFILIKTVINAITIEVSRMFGKKVIFPILCKLQGLNSKDAESIKVPSVEVPLKLITYSLIGINVTALLPVVFKHLYIDL